MEGNGEYIERDGKRKRNGEQKNHSEEKREGERKGWRTRVSIKFVVFVHHLFANIGTVMGDFWDNRLHSLVYLGV